MKFPDIVTSRSARFCLLPYVTLLHVRDLLYPSMTPLTDPRNEVHSKLVIVACEQGTPAVLLTDATRISVGRGEKEIQAAPE